jgi:hypothetical protein
MQNLRGFPIVNSRINFSSLGFGKVFISNLSQLNYDGCGIMVITSGCGPGNEGSIPSFHPKRSEDRLKKLFLKKSSFFPSFIQRGLK